ncbi:MAG TPA: hypothetical protein VKB24_01465 [Candidatus Acidoferrum sp.]|nr:hypothetical protein [Candidatus Acidoferrum sp.]
MAGRGCSAGARLFPVMARFSKPKTIAASYRSILNTMARRQQYFFAYPISNVAFGANRRRLLVLTGD